MTTLSTWTLSGLMLVSTGYGQLTLIINNVTEEIALMGSSSGQPRESGGFGSVNFQLSGLALSSIGDFKPNNLSWLSRPETSPNPRVQTVFTDLSITYLFDSFAPLTINGTGTFIDYASAFSGFPAPGDPTPADAINSIPDGAILTLVDGTGFDGGILVSVIPEPTSFGLILGCASALLLFGRRQRVRISD